MNEWDLTCTALPLAKWYSLEQIISFGIQAMVFKVCGGGQGSVTPKRCLKMPHEWKLLLEFSKKRERSGILKALHCSRHSGERNASLQRLVSALSKKYWRTLPSLNFLERMEVKKKGEEKEHILRG